MVPAHDAEALTIARRLGLAPVEVLDATGIVRATARWTGWPATRPGPRRELLVAEGAVVERRRRSSTIDRCRRCGTVLVPRLGQHWFLPMADLEVAAADAVRQGAVEFAPATARDDLLARAGDGGDWCLSHQVWAGQPVPVSTCLDCGSLDVAVDAVVVVRQVHGHAGAGDDVLDARFVGALWPLARRAGPTTRRGRPTPAPHHAGGQPGGVAWWALPMAALGAAPGRRRALRLRGRPARGRPARTIPTRPLPVDLDARTADAGRRAVRPPWSPAASTSTRAAPWSSWSTRHPRARAASTSSPRRASPPSSRRHARAHGRRPLASCPLASPAASGPPTMGRVADLAAAILGDCRWTAASRSSGVARRPHQPGPDGGRLAPRAAHPRPGAAPHRR